MDDKLQKFLQNNFSLDELKLLLFNLSIDHETIFSSNATLPVAALHIVQYFKTRPKDELYERLAVERSEVFQQEFGADGVIKSRERPENNYYLLDQNTLISGEQDVYRIDALVPMYRDSDLRGAISYRAKDTKNNDVFIKTMAIHKSWTNRSITDEAKRFDEDLDTQYLQFHRLEKISGVAHILDRGKYRLSKEGRAGNYPEISFLVQEYIHGHNLEDYLRSSEPNRLHLGKDARIEDWVDFAKKLIEVVGEVHKSGIIHGDISPSNIIIRDRQPVLVDFGESFLWRNFFNGRAKDPRYVNPYLAPERRREVTDFTTESDIYSIGGVLYKTATGEDPPEPTEELADPRPDIFGSLDFFAESLTDKERSEIKSLWKLHLFEQLDKKCPDFLEGNLGVKDVIALCMHVLIDDRARHTEEVLDTLDAFIEVTHKSSKTAYKNIIKMSGRLVGDLMEFALEDDVRDTLFRKMLESELLRFQRTIKDIMGGYQVEITGSRDELIIGLLKFMSELHEGDSFLTLTSPQFWLPQNLGYSGRFMRMNEMLAVRNVTIRRIFMLTDNDLAGSNDQEVMHRKVLKAHQELMTRLSSQKIPIRDRLTEGRGFFTGYIVKPSVEQRKRVLQHNKPVGLIRKSNDEFVALFFRTEAADGIIHRIQIRKWDADVANNFLLEMRQALKDAEPLLGLDLL